MLLESPPYMQPRVGQSSSFEGGVAMIKEKKKKENIYKKKKNLPNYQPFAI
jgi:hypothetical protein